MRIVVYGAGAIGSLVGALLSRAGHEVTLLCREAHAEEVRRSGISVEGLSTFRARPDVVSSLPALVETEVDLIILTTKAYDTEAAAREIARLAPVPVLSLQNGLDNHALLARHLGMDRVYMGTTSIGVTFLGPGRVRHAGRGPTKVGEPTRQADATTARMIARLLDSAGLPTEYSSDILGEIWRKGVVNNAINPLTAIHRVPNGAILERPELRRAAGSLAREAALVARALGYLVGDAVEGVARVARETAANRSSMLQDVERGRRTEIDHITGVIVREARAHGIRVPTSRWAHSRIKAMEPGREGPTRPTKAASTKGPSAPRRSPGRSRRRARSVSGRPKRPGPRRASRKRRSRR